MTLRAVISVLQKEDGIDLEVRGTERGTGNDGEGEGGSGGDSVTRDRRPSSSRDVCVGDFFKDSFATVEHSTKAAKRVVVIGDNHGLLLCYQEEEEEDPEEVVGRRREEDFQANVGVAEGRTYYDGDFREDIAHWYYS